jgi:hypothetical protein
VRMGRAMRIISARIPVTIRKIGMALGIAQSGKSEDFQQGSLSLSPTYAKMLVSAHSQKKSPMQCRNLRILKPGVIRIIAKRIEVRAALEGCQQR